MISLKVVLCLANSALKCLWSLGFLIAIVRRGHCSVFTPGISRKGTVSTLPQRIAGTAASAAEVGVPQALKRAFSCHFPARLKACPYEYINNENALEIGRFENRFSSHYGQQSVDGMDLIRRDGEIVFIEHDEIREFSWLQRADFFFLHQ